MCQNHLDLQDDEKIPKKYFNLKFQVVKNSFSAAFNGERPFCRPDKKVCNLLLNLCVKLYHNVEEKCALDGADKGQ